MCAPARILKLDGEEVRELRGGVRLQRLRRVELGESGRARRGVDR